MHYPRPSLGRCFGPDECVSPIEYHRLPSPLNGLQRFQVRYLLKFLVHHRLRDIAFCAYLVSLCAGNCAMVSEPSTGGDSDRRFRFSDTGRGYRS